MKKTTTNKLEESLWVRTLKWPIAHMLMPMHIMYAAEEIVISNYQSPTDLSFLMTVLVPVWASWKLDNRVKYRFVTLFYRKLTVWRPQIKIYSVHNNNICNS